MSQAMPRETYREETSGWVTAGVTFAGVLMLMIGGFHALTGLAALLDDQFYVVTQNYWFEFDVTAWGWIHLLAGVIAVVAGIYLFSGATWARVVGIAFAVLSALINFAFIPYYPFWSLLIIALDVWIVWALSRPAPVDVRA
jgi:hypothetical protein